MKNIITIACIAVSALAFPVLSAHAQPVDQRAAAEAFNYLNNRMKITEDKMEMLVKAWDVMLGSAVIGFNSQRCPNGWTPFARANALLVVGPDGSNQALELKNVPNAAIGPRGSMADSIPAQKLLFCVRATR